MALVHTLDHGAQAYAHLLEQFKAVDGWAKFLACFTAQIQDLEDAAWDLNTKRLLAGAGAQLDQLGRILDEPREGFDDLQYLERLKAKILILRSNGASPDIVAIYKRLLPLNIIKFTQRGGAGFILDVGLINPDYATIYQRFLHEATSAGINGQLTYQTTIDLTSFFTDFGSVLTANFTGGGTVFTVADTAFFSLGDLVAIDPGVGDCLLFVVNSIGVGTVTSGIVIGTSYSAGAALSVIAHAGTFAPTTTVGAVTTAPLPAGHPFVVGDEVVIDPFLSTQEGRTVTAVTSTSMSFTPALAFSHTGAYVIHRIHQGWGDTADATAGGKLSGVIT